MTIRNLTWKRARKFYFAAIAAGTALVQGNFVEGTTAKWVLGTIAVLAAMSTWLFENDPPVGSTKFTPAHSEG